MAGKIVVQIVLITVLPAMAVLRYVGSSTQREAQSADSKPAYTHICAHIAKKKHQASACDTLVSEPKRAKTD